MYVGIGYIEYCWGSDIGLVIGVFCFLSCSVGKVWGVLWVVGGVGILVLVFWYVLNWFYIGFDYEIDMGREEEFVGFFLKNKWKVLLDLVFW